MYVLQRLPSLLSGLVDDKAALNGGSGGGMGVVVQPAHVDELSGNDCDKKFKLLCRAWRLIIVFEKILILDKIA